MSEYDPRPDRELHDIPRGEYWRHPDGRHVIAEGAVVDEDAVDWVFVDDHWVPVRPWSADKFRSGGYEYVGHTRHSWVRNDLLGTLGLDVHRTDAIGDQARHEAQRSEFEKLQQEADTSRQENADLKRELHNVKSRLGNATWVAERSKAKADEWKTAIVKANEACQRKDFELKDAQRKIEKLSGELEGRDCAELDLAHEREAYDRLREKLTEMERIAEELRKALATRTQERDEAQDKARKIHDVWREEKDRFNALYVRKQDVHKQLATALQDKDAAIRSAANERDAARRAREARNLAEKELVQRRDEVIELESKLECTSAALEMERYEYGLKDAMVTKYAKRIDELEAELAVSMHRRALIPWRVKAEHKSHRLYRFLVVEAKNRDGFLPTGKDLAIHSSVIRDLLRDPDAVITYTQGRGFRLVARRPEDRDFIREIREIREENAGE